MRERVHIEISGDQAKSTAVQVYESPGVTAIQGTPGLIDAVAQGSDFRTEAERVSVLAETAGGIDREAVIEAIRNIPGVETIEYDATVAGWSR